MTATGTVVGGAAVLSGFVGAGGAGVVTGRPVSWVVACVGASGMVVRAVVGLAGVGASVAASVFTLAAGVAGAAGPASVAGLLLLATVVTAAVVDIAVTTSPATLGGAAVVLAFVVEGVSASLSSGSVQMLERRKPEEGKRRHDCERTGACG